MLMSCRYCRVSLIIAATLFSLIFAKSHADAQPYLVQRLLNRNHDQGPVESANFIVYANDRLLAARVSQEAERYRKSLAAEWLGRELPAWRQKCPIKVTIDLHPGGETSFAFVPNHQNRMTPVDWDMKIFGPPDRILDAVLPHEITHTIFATHFGRPLPRWADEGACTTVEHISEQSKNHRMLLEFLNTSRGIPFNRMFSMKDYPADILPLYAQGFSLAKYLIFQKGKRHFLDYIDRGMQYEDKTNPVTAWNRATNEFYPFEDLSDLQLAWVAWVRNGSSKQAAAKLGNQNLAAADKAATFYTATKINNRAPQSYDSPATSIAQALPRSQARIQTQSQLSNNRVRSLLDTPAQSQAVGTFTRSNDSWYASQMQQNRQAQSAQPSSTTFYRKVPIDKESNQRPSSDLIKSGPIVHDSRHHLPSSSAKLR